VVGACFYYDTPPNGRHPWVVLAPCPEKPGWYICVNISTKRGGEQFPCELQRDEHPILTSDVSIPKFVNARELPHPLVAREVAVCGFEEFAASLMQRIYTAAVLQDSAMPKPFKAAIASFLAQE